MLTARDEEADRVAGLEVGADDYVAKPFSPPRADRAGQGGAAPGRQRVVGGGRAGCPRLRSAGDNGAWGVGDEGRLRQATSNLVENALRLTPAGGSVEVRARPGSISVRGTGPGLAAQDLPRAFDRSYLHDRYRSERAVGSGLGLAIVKELTVAMGGEVSAAHSPGGGAEFTIRVPADGPEATIT
ncbi:MAG TPA: ATP-binding protein [Solirubrobacteraceae bacterium]|nr:ATP-binding protein [Solirubrobacteraceae bacterium]